METIKMVDADFANLGRILRKVDFFAPLTIGQLDLILPYIVLCRFDKGEAVFKQGVAGDSFYVVYDGEVSVKVKKGLFSFTKKVASLGTGSFFGEMSLLTREPRSATVTCEKEARLFMLLADDFDVVVKKNPAFAAEINKIASHRKAMSGR